MECFTLTVAAKVSYSYVKVSEVKIHSVQSNQLQSKKRKYCLWYFSSCRDKSVPSFMLAYSHYPSRRELDDGEALLCAQYTQRGWWLHSFLHKWKIKHQLLSASLSAGELNDEIMLAAPAAMAPTSGTRHICTRLHQVPMISTTPSGSLITRQSSSVVDYTDRTN